MMDESWNDIPLYTIYQNNVRKPRSNCGVTGQLILYRTYSNLTQSFDSSKQFIYCENIVTTCNLHTIRS